MKKIFEILNIANMDLQTNKKAKLIYCDPIYEDLNFKGWIDKYWNLLDENSIFCIQTDYHTVAQMKIYMDSLENSNFVSWVIWLQEWGGKPKKGFPMKHDDILIYSNGLDYQWFADKVQIPKKTAGTKLDKKGTGLKTPCSVWYDIPFSTIAKERVKKEDGKNIRWQKSQTLIHRLFSPFLKEGDLVIDPFMGSGSCAEYCLKNDYEYIGIERDKKVFDLARKRLYNIG
jgi:site-specific DNA-methyltransferase (adenine-specific)